MTRARFIIGVAAVLAMGIADKGETHSWYDGDCCDMQDCYQTSLGEIERHADGWFVVATQEKIAFDDERIRRSLDPLIHRCVVTTWIKQAKLPREQSPTRCLYVPEMPV